MSLDYHVIDIVTFKILSLNFLIHSAPLIGMHLWLKSYSKLPLVIDMLDHTPANSHAVV